MTILSSIITPSNVLTATNQQTVTNKIFTGLVETRVSLGAGSGTQTLDLNNGNYFLLAVNGTATLAVSNVPSSGSVGAFILEITDGGGYTLNYFSGVTWPGGSAPSLSSSGTDVLGFFTTDNGTTWRGFVLGLDMS
jgi:hypothetical protein